MTDELLPTKPSQRDEYVALLDANVCNLIFKKADSSERKMLATRKVSLIYPKAEDEEEKREIKPEPNQNVIFVFDLENDAWRSFRVDSVILLEKAE